MAQTFLLPCPSCEQKIQVVAAQAGRELKCSCGQTVTAPTLREMRNLESVSLDEPVSARSSWTLTQGIMFSCGMLVMIVALILGSFPYTWRSYISLEKPPPPNMTEIEMAVDELEPVETLEVWDQLLERGANREGPPPHIALRETADWLNILIGVAAVAAVGGLASVIASFFMGKPERKTR